MGHEPVREWTSYDDGLLSTLHVVNNVLRDQGTRLHHLHPPFVTDYAGGERVYTQAPLQVLDWAAPGDGSYQHSSSFFLATGRGGLAMTAAVAAFRSAENSDRRAQAARDAIPRWLPVDQGTAWISNRGLWLQTMRGVFLWPWESMQGMQVLGQGHLQIQGQSSAGPINWQIVSPGAELVFALWVLARRVPHPQWLDRSWIPTNWIPWATSLGRPTPFGDLDELGDIDATFAELEG